MSDIQKQAFAWLGFAAVALAFVWGCIGTGKVVSATLRSTCDEYIAGCTSGGHTKFSCAERYGCVQYLGRQILEASDE